METKEKTNRTHMHTNQTNSGILLPNSLEFVGLPEETEEIKYSISRDLADEDVRHIQPLNFDVLIEVFTGEEETKSGIVIGDAHYHRNYGTIVAVDEATAKAKHLPHTLRNLKPGMVVLFQHHQLLTLPNPGGMASKYALVPLAMIRAVL